MYPRVVASLVAFEGITWRRSHGSFRAGQDICNAFSTLLLATHEAGRGTPCAPMPNMSQS